LRFSLAARRRRDSCPLNRIFALKMEVSLSPRFFAPMGFLDPSPSSSLCARSAQTLSVDQIAEEIASLPDRRSISEDRFVELFETAFARGIKASDFPGTRTIEESVARIGFPSEDDVDFVVSTFAFLPLHWAVARGFGLPALRACLAVGFDPLACDVNNGVGTALHVAVETSADARGVGPLLLAAGARVDVAFGPNGLLPLHRVFSAKSAAAIEWLDFLLENGAQIDALDAEGFSALAQSVLHNHPAVFRALVARGASVGLAGRDGRTALHRAAELSRPELLGELLALGADFLARDDEGLTPFHFASGGHVFRPSPASLGALLDHASRPEILPLIAPEALRDNAGRLPSALFGPAFDSPALAALAGRMRAFEELVALRVAAGEAPPPAASRPQSRL
jgi:hypothetical protein